MQQQPTRTSKPHAAPVLTYTLSVCGVIATCSTQLQRQTPLLTAELRFACVQLICSLAAPCTGSHPLFCTDASPPQSIRRPQAGSFTPPVRVPQSASPSSSARTRASHSSWRVSVARGRTMTLLFASRAPAFSTLFLTPLPANHSPRLSTRLARLPVVGHRRRTPARVAAVANGLSAEEELFIRRHAAQSSKSPAKPDDQFDFVPKTNADAPPDRPPRIHSDDLPQLQAPPKPPDPPPDVVPSTSTPRVSREPNSQKPVEKPESAPKPARVRILATPPSRRVIGRVRRGLGRFIEDSSTGDQIRLPTGREAFTAAWELVVIFAVLMLLRAGVARTLRWIHNRLNATRGLKSNIPYEASVFECMQRPLEFLSLFTVGTALGEAVSRPLAATGLLRHIRTLRELGIIFSATWFLLRWIDRIRSRFAVDKRVDKSQVDATSRIATVATFIVSLLISLDTIGINIQTVLAFGGIGGVAIGFAGREIISNFFGGFMIYVTRPFSVGEWIRSIEESELNGTVEDIGWYLTRVRTWDKRPLYIPNSRFSTLIVENGSRMHNRRILHTLHIRHEDMPVVSKIVADVESYLMDHPELDPRQHRLAYVDSFDEFSVKVWLSCYTKSVFLYDFRRVQQNVLIKFYEIVRARGAKLATRNTRDVRPGTDTDRYGPYGSAATFGEEFSGVPLPNTPISPTPSANVDVPGAPLSGIPNSVEFMHTIESGIDPARYGKTTESNGVPAAAESSGAGVPAGSSVSDEKRKHIPLSNAAVAASAAAFLAARRNAMRIESTGSSRTPKSISNEIENPETPSIAPETSAGPTAPSREMKITAAPPRGSPSGTGVAMSKGSGESAITGNMESRISDENSPLANGTVGSGASPTQGGRVGSEETGPVVKAAGGTMSSPPLAAGTMKITKARKPNTILATQESGDSVSDPPLPETSVTRTKVGGADAQQRSTVEAPKTGKPASTPIRTGEEATSRASGEMKISKARAPATTNANLGPDKTMIEAPDAAKSVGKGAQGNGQSTGKSVQDIKAQPKQALGNKSAGSTPGSPGKMRVTGERPANAAPASPETKKQGETSGSSPVDSSRVLENGITPSPQPGSPVSGEGPIGQTSQQSAKEEPTSTVPTGAMNISGIGQTKSTTGTMGGSGNEVQRQDGARIEGIAQNSNPTSLEVDEGNVES